MIPPQFKSDKALFTVYCIFVILGVVALFYAIIGYCAQAWGKPAIFTSALPLALAGALFVRLLLLWKSRPERVFLLVAIPALLGFGMFFLPHHIPDEILHIYRMFSLEMPAYAMVVPVSLDVVNLPNDYGELFSLLNSNYSWSESFTTEFDMSNYLPHLYLIPGITVKCCMLLNVNPLLAVYCARLTNALLYVIAGYWIIRTMPLIKVATCIYLLNPMIIQQEASCSADALTNILCLLFIALLFKARFTEPITRNTVVGLAVLFIFVALSKYVYALLVYLFLLLVPKIEKKRTRSIAYAAAGLLSVIGCFAAMLFLARSSFRPTYDLITNPPELIAMLYRTIVAFLPDWFEQFAGSYLGMLDIFIWKPIVWCYVIVLLASIVFNFGEKNTFPTREKICITALFFVVSIALILIFVNWASTIGAESDTIIGVQGRYFIPFAILPLSCLSTPRSSLVRENCLVLYASLLCAIFAADVFQVMLSFA